MRVGAVFALFSCLSCVLSQTQAYIPGLEELDCAKGEKAATWLSVKGKMRKLFEKPGGAMVRTEKTVLSETFDSIYKELTAAKALSPQSEGECAMGRLSFQLLALTYSEPEVLIELFSSMEKLASPTLTTLLDVPWLAVAQSGWPMFGLLAEINLQKVHAGVTNKAIVDGLDKPIGQAFYQELMNGIVKGDGAAIGQVTNLYLNIDDKERNAYATLCALVAGASSSEAKQRMQILDVLQTGLKQVITNPLELDVALGSQWPFWGLTHVATDVFTL